MASIGVQLVIVSEPHGYYVDKAGVLTKILDPTFLAWGASHVTSDSGFALFVAPNSQIFFKSPFNDASGPYDGLEFGLASKYGDDANSVLAAQSQLLVGCNESIELWYATGAVPFPYARNPTSVIDIGVQARHTLISDNLTVYFLGDDLSFYRMQLGSIAPERISKSYFTEELQKYDRTDDAYAFITKISGNHHLVVTFPDAERTWSFAVNTGQWFERESYGMKRWNVDDAVEIWNKHILFQHNGKKSGVLNQYTGNEWGAHQIKTWTYPVVYAEGKLARHARLWLDVDTGFGPLTEEHFIEMEISDDGGETFRFGPRASIGTRGKYGYRVSFNGLGSSDERAYRLSFSGNARLKCRDTQLEAEQARL